MGNRGYYINVDPIKLHRWGKCGENPLIKKA